jgi:hypothetical protein
VIQRAPLKNLHNYQIVVTELYDFPGIVQSSAKSGLNEVCYENYAEWRLLYLVLRLVRFAQSYPLDTDRKDGGGLRRLLYPAIDH